MNTHVYLQSHAFKFLSKIISIADGVVVLSSNSIISVPMII
jgi:hypothetical protein